MIESDLYHFGDYIARVSGYRDWQLDTNGHYQRDSKRVTKEIIELVKYIGSDLEIAKQFFSAAFQVTKNNKAYVAGRFLTGRLFNLSKGKGGTLALVGGVTNTAKDIDNFARNIVLGNQQ